MDLFINVLFTSIFGIWWYLITDHLLLAETEKPKQNNELINNKEAVKVLETSTLPAWKAESAIAIIILISTALIHKPYYPSSGIIPVPRVSASGTSLLKPEDNSRRHLSVELEDEELPFNY
ncbi:9876_t:CDS:2 [Funneliformis mosseae]|uniref:9876_t:CDS:1 n=1 Tax=Funneliformis mosseae TaxID=27381 RepID=A0A9N9FD79_FUNMO|nr:9876_t:CDS:2 [Funneliformis mosseae]